MKGIRVFVELKSCVGELGGHWGATYMEYLVAKE